MSSALLMDRPALGGPGYGTAGFGASAPTFAPGATAANWCLLPRCTMKMEKCTGGFKLHCKCEDEMASGTLQNLCKMLSGGMFCCTCTMNGMCVCQCNLTCGICTCESTKDGVCLSCVSGDAACCKMIQACCDCLQQCLASGCNCYLSCGGTPVCCGCAS